MSFPEQIFQDRVHTSAENVPEITIAGLHLFLDNVLHSKNLPVREHVISALLGQVRVERDGYSINRSAMKECVEIYTTLINSKNGVKVYYEDLEPSFLNESQGFYATEAQKLLETCDAPEYLRRASPLSTMCYKTLLTVQFTDRGALGLRGRPGTSLPGSDHRAPPAEDRRETPSRSQFSDYSFNARFRAGRHDRCR
jgi:hypothetical protein